MSLSTAQIADRVCKALRDDLVLVREDYGITDEIMVYVSRTNSLFMYFEFFSVQKRLKMTYKIEIEQALKPVGRETVSSIRRQIIRMSLKTLGYDLTSK